MTHGIQPEHLFGGFGKIGKQDFIDKVIEPILANYGKKMKPQTACEWYGALKHYFPSTLEAAVKKVTEERKTMPAPCHIKAHCIAVEGDKAAEPPAVCTDAAAAALWAEIKAAYLADARQKYHWQNWLSRCTPGRLTGDRLTVTAPNAFFADTLNNAAKGYSRLLHDMLAVKGINAGFVVG